MPKPAKYDSATRRGYRIAQLGRELVDAILAGNHKLADKIMVQIDNLEQNRKRRLVAVQEPT